MITKTKMLAWLIRGSLTNLGEAFGTGASILVANPTLFGQNSLPSGVTLNLPDRVETLVGYMMDVRGIPTNQAEFNRLSLSLQSAANDMLANFAKGVTPNFQRLEPGESVPEGFQGHMFTAADGTRVLAWGRVGNSAQGSRNCFERADGSVGSEIAHPPRCFLAGTPILMADGQEKPIEDIRVGDMVMSFDPAADQGRGALVPRLVSRTFQNITRSIIELRGLYMTPGHVCLTDDGRFETIAEILLRDGILI
jgi:hypothetical protein